jgi:hypothetical protein
MENKTNILNRITPEDIEAWLLAKREMEGLSSLAPHCLNTQNYAWVYWSLQTRSLCVHGDTFAEALRDLRSREREPKKLLIRERREHAARLLAEADEMERGEA